MDNAFGYVEIEDNKIKSVTGDPKNPEIHYFENAEIVNAVNLLNELKRRIKKYEEEAEDRVLKLQEWLKDHKDDHESIPGYIMYNSPPSTISVEELSELIRRGERKLLEEYNK